MSVTAIDTSLQQSHCGKIEDKLNEARATLMFCLGQELHSDLVLHVQQYVNDRAAELNHYEGEL